MTVAMAMRGFALTATALTTVMGPAWGSSRVLINTAVACTTAEVRARMQTLAISGDRQAFMLYGMRAIQSGACVVLKPGTQIVEELAPLFSSIVPVRVLGSPDRLWVDYDEIRR